MSFDKELLPPSGVERNYFYPMGQLDINHVTCDSKDKYCQVYELCHECENLSSFFFLQG